jgi:hypothetical protein
MPLDALQRHNWNGEPTELGLLFSVHTERGEKSLAAVCRLLSHRLGWEMRLEVNGDLQRSQVCRLQDEVLTTSDRWRDDLVENGWR